MCVYIHIIDFFFCLRYLHFRILYIKCEKWNIVENIFKIYWFIEAFSVHLIFDGTPKEKKSLKKVMLFAAEVIQIITFLIK